MSTYDPNAIWNKDYDQLNQDLATWKSEQADYQAAVEAYHEGMARIAGTSDAMVAFTMLAWLMANEGSGQLNLQTASDGGSLQIQGDLTRLGNDIEDETNQNSTSSSYLDDVAVHSHVLANDLTTNQDLIGAIGSDASNALAGQYNIIRGEIWDTNAAAGPNATTTQYYFDASGDYPPVGGKDPLIQNYAEFQTDLQSRGDLKSANEVAKEKTDAFNENTSTTQSTNAASQETISNDSNMAKAVQAFTVDMFHAVMDVISAANKATTRGG